MVSFVAFDNTIVQGYLFGAPIMAIGLSIIFMFLHYRSTNAVNKQIFLVLLLIMPYIFLYPFAQYDSFYSKLIILYTVLLLFPIFWALYDLVLYVYKSIMDWIRGRRKF